MTGISMFCGERPLRRSYRRTVPFGDGIVPFDVKSVPFHDGDNRILSEVIVRVWHRIKSETAVHNLYYQKGVLEVPLLAADFYAASFRHYCREFEHIIFACIFSNSSCSDVLYARKTMP